MQKVSARGLAEIASHEAIVCSPYKDSVGVWTIGIGHTAAAGGLDPSKHKGTISIDEVLALFAKDIEKYEARVRKAFTSKLTRAQFDAAVSFDFNTGGILRASWVKHFNAGKNAAARKAFMAWRKPAEIIKRRQAECNLFFDGRYSGDGSCTVYQASRTGRIIWKNAKRIKLPELTVADVPVKRPARKPKRAKAKSYRPNPKSAILPLYRPKQDDPTTLAVLDHFVELTPADRRNDKVKVLAVRGYYQDSMGKVGQNDRRVYDDAFFVVSPEGVQAFNGNSDPAAYRKRIATIMANQAIRYIPGKHGLSRRDGGYPAFRQNSDITVLRDGVGEDRDGNGKRFWCNLHRGGKATTSSLGCLTIPPHQWDEFRDLLNGLLEKYGQQTFYLTLVEYPDDKPPASVNHRPSASAPAIAAVAAAGAAGYWHEKVLSWWDQFTSWIGALL